MTNFNPLSPDVLVTVLLDEKPGWRWALRAYEVDSSGGLNTWLPPNWEDVQDTLLAESDGIDEQLTPNQRYIEWKKRGLNSLPAGVFVWRDELERDYARTFGKPDYVPPTDDETIRAECMNDSHAPAPPRREGERALRIERTPEPKGDLRKLLFEGFEDAAQRTWGSRRIDTQGVSQVGDARSTNAVVGTQTVSRTGAQIAFREINWQPVWNKERSNGLAAVRLGKINGQVHYDREGFAEWLWNHKGVPRIEAFQRLGLSIPAEREGKSQATWTSVLHRVK